MHPKVCGSVSILEPSLGIELGHEATRLPHLGKNSEHVNKSDNFGRNKIKKVSNMTSPEGDH